MTTLPDLAGWLPIRVYWSQAQPMIDWCFVGERRLTEPFFDQTVEACFKHPFNLLFRHQTPIDVLSDAHAIPPGVPPTGFIFHMSRCGSTLIAQMLAVLPQNIVISEASPIDAVLRAHFRDPHVTDAQRIRWLQGMVNAFGQRRLGQEQHLLIKFDSWSVLDLPLIQRAFPNVPWVFVFRDPVEVMVSHLNHRGSQMLPGVLEPALFGLDFAVIGQMSLNEYAARVLATVCNAAVEQRERGAGRLMHYHDLPDAVSGSLLPFFDIAPTPDDVARMSHVAQFHAKNPVLPFEDDTAAKQRAATDEARQLVDRWVRPVYERLRVLHATQAAV